jgi:asparagine synthase (glutamine-hydrolysing)
VDDWLRDSAKGCFGDTLRDPSAEIYRLLKPAAVQELLTAHQAGQRDHHKLLFSCIVCETLLRSSSGHAVGEASPVATVGGS